MNLISLFLTRVLTMIESTIRSSSQIKTTFRKCKNKSSCVSMAKFVLVLFLITKTTSIDLVWINKSTKRSYFNTVLIWWRLTNDTWRTSRGTKVESNSLETTNKPRATILTSLEILWERLLLKAPYQPAYHKSSRDSWLSREVSSSTTTAIRSKIYW